MPYKPLDLAEVSQLTFMKPDHDKYPCIRLAYDAGRAGGTMTAVLNAANEAAKLTAEACVLYEGPVRKVCFTNIQYFSLYSV